MPNLNVTYAEMTTAANKLASGKTEIENSLSALKSLVDSLVSGGYVTDKSSVQFDSSYQTFDSGARQMIDGLDGISSYLNTAASTFEAADDQLARQLQQS